MNRLKGTVLISNRNKGLLTALVLLLQKAFSNVITQDVPDRIIERAAAGDVDIVVLDTGQNGGSGQEEHISLIKGIAALEQNIQVVVLSNFGQSQFAMELAELGAFDFVPKPWNNEKLLVTLRNAYRMRQLATALSMANSNNGRLGIEETEKNVEKEEPQVKERILTLEQMEKKMMKAAVKRCRGNISLAAEQLGITRQTLYNKGKKYKLFE